MLTRDKKQQIYRSFADTMLRRCLMTDVDYSGFGPVFLTRLLMPRFRCDFAVNVAIVTNLCRDFLPILAVIFYCP